MNKKRTSLEDVFGPAKAPPSSAPVVQSTMPVREDKRRPAVKQQTVYLPLPVHEQLRKVAFEEHAKMHDLLIEGLELVFTKRGLPGISELTRTRVRL